MTKTARTKAANPEFEVLPDHPLLTLLQQPKSIQGQWQFVYTFIANLCLTGWAYVVGGVNKGKMELYSLPTTWVTPKHEDGPFSSFLVQNPNKPDVSKAVELTRENVAFAHLPNPADPLTAIAPSQSQLMAIRVDDHIQTSQERFFENGIFPSVVISIGRDPHPDVPGGFRPRLTGPQRRQVIAAIQKTMGGVSNYGEPAIVDGLIESVDRLSSTQTEMGWEKSETAVNTNSISVWGASVYSEWSSPLLAHYAAGWDWVGMNLDNGASLTAFQIRRRGSGEKLYAYASLREAGTAKAQVFAADEVNFDPIERWTSPRTRGAWPVAQRIRVGSRTFETRPLFADQELDSRASTSAVYWEGASLLTEAGRRVGRGYLEMTGYVEPIRL